MQKRKNMTVLSDLSQKIAPVSRQIAPMSRQICSKVPVFCVAHAIYRSISGLGRKFACLKISILRRLSVYCVEGIPNRMSAEIQMPK